MNSPHPPPNHILVLTLDGLGAGHLATYGSGAYPSPQFNRLAAQSLLLDQAVAAGAAAEGQPLGGSLGGPAWEALPQRILITDDPQLPEHRWADPFDEVVPIGVTRSLVPADAVESTELAQFFAQLLDALLERPAQGLTWVHSRGLLAAWDAPHDWRLRLADPEDPPPPSFVEPPLGWFDTDQDDPDQLLALQLACAAQVQLLDQLLGVLLDFLETPEFDRTILVVTSGRGYPLGEHGTIGWDPKAASEPNRPGMGFAEQHQVPAFIRFPANSDLDVKAARSLSLCGPELLVEMALAQLAGDHQTFTELLDAVAFALPDPRRELIWGSNPQGAFLQTQAWKLVRSPDQQHTRLYAKPDDRWEVNDVQRRCPAIVEGLQALLDQAPHQPLGSPLPNLLALREE